MHQLGWVLSTLNKLKVIWGSVVSDTSRRYLPSVGECTSPHIEITTSADQVVEHCTMRLSLFLLACNNIIESAKNVQNLLLTNTAEYERTEQTIATRPQGNPIIECTWA